MKENLTPGRLVIEILTVEYYIYLDTRKNYFEGIAFDPRARRFKVVDFRKSTKLCQNQIWEIMPLIFPNCFNSEFFGLDIKNQDIEIMYLQNFKKCSSICFPF